MPPLQVLSLVFFPPDPAAWAPQVWVISILYPLAFHNTPDSNSKVNIQSESSRWSFLSLALLRHALHEIKPVFSLASGLCLSQTSCQQERQWGDSLSGQEDLLACLCLPCGVGNRQIQTTTAELTKNASQLTSVSLCSFPRCPSHSHTRAAIPDLSPSPLCQAECPALTFPFVWEIGRRDGGGRGS